MATRRQLLIGTGAGILALGITGDALRRQMGSMADYNGAVAAMRRAAAMPSESRNLIRFATLAPNGHNAQPWRFHIEANQITILPDFKRRTPAVDPDDHHVFVSLGCAAENLALAAGAIGRGGEINFQLDGDGAVGVTLGSAGGEQALFDAIPHRQSTRSDYDNSTVSVPDLALLVEAAKVPRVDVILMTGRPAIYRIRDLVIAANAAQINDPAFVTELKQWLRFSPATALRLGDGLFSAASGSPTLPDWLGPLLFDIVFTEKAETARYASQIASSAGLVVFAGEKSDPEHWVQVGRACQRFALQATALGLKCAFLNQPVEVEAFRAELAGLIGLPGRRPDLVMRFGCAAPLPFSSRRAVEDVMT